MVRTPGGRSVPEPWTKVVRDRATVHQRFGAVSQLAGIRPIVLSDGRADGIRAFDVRTGGGLRFDVLASRGLDIGMAEYRGLPIAWRSPAGDVVPSRHDPAGSGWLRSFGGGLVTGCGLRSVGAPSANGTVSFGLHGELSNTPAEQVSADEGWEGEAYVLRIRGTVREVSALGDHLVLRRTISARLGDAAVDIDDEVTNEGIDPTPHMLLYHINLGYPVVSEHSHLVAACRRVDPRDRAAAEGLAGWSTFPTPLAHGEEQVFYLDTDSDQDGCAEVAIVRSAPDPLGVAVTYSRRTLPQFVLWKHMRAGIYAAGLEPSTNRVDGFAIEAERGRVGSLEPGETRRYHVRVRVLTSADEIQTLRNRSPPV